MRVVMRERAVTPRPAADGAVVTKAVLRAVERLGLSSRVLARTLGVSEATVSRMRAGAYVLARDSKPFEVAVLFLRLFRSLDAIVAGDEQSARGWLQAQNTALGGVPGELIQTLPGLVNIVGYVDARRALL
jgi:hypothetical protein